MAAGLYRDARPSLLATYRDAVAKQLELYARLVDHRAALHRRWPVLRKHHLPPLPPAPREPNLEGLEALDDAAAAELVRREELASKELAAAEDRLRSAIEAGRSHTPAVLPLAPGPRSVPRVYFWSEFLLSGFFGPRILSSWFFVLIFALAPLGILSAFAPHLCWLLPALAFPVQLFAALYKARRRQRALRRAEVALVGSAHGEPTSTRYRNWGVPTAVGWRIDDSTYSGDAHRNTLRYTTADGALAHPKHEFHYLGRPYEGGVILYDPQRTEHAWRIESFLSQPQPDLLGQWWAERPLPWTRRASLTLATSLALFGAGCAVYVLFWLLRSLLGALG